MGVYTGFLHYISPPDNGSQFSSLRAVSLTNADKVIELCTYYWCSCLLDVEGRLIVDGRVMWGGLLISWRLTAVDWGSWVMWWFLNGVRWHDWAVNRYRCVIGDWGNVRLMRIFWDCFWLIEAFSIFCYNSDCYYLCYC